MIKHMMQFCQDAWLNPEELNMEKTEYESDVINKLKFEDFEKPEHKEGEVIKETDDYIATAITNNEFKELFGFVYPF